MITPITSKDISNCIKNTLLPVSPKESWHGREVYCIANWAACISTWTAIVVTIAIGVFGASGSLTVSLLAVSATGFIAHTLKKLCSTLANNYFLNQLNQALNEHNKLLKKNYQLVKETTSLLKETIDLQKGCN